MSAGRGKYHQSAHSSLPTAINKTLFRSDHAVECSILSIIRAKLRRNQQGEKMYRNNLSGLTAAVTTLRLVSLKWR